MMQKFAVPQIELFKMPQEQESICESEVAVYLAEDVKKVLTRPDVWSTEESDLLVNTFMRANEKHGLRESLFAALTAWLDYKRDGETK